MHTPSLASFRSAVWNYWRKNGRHSLPWRKASDPYKILVSEVMLQQTQVNRVVPYYKKFLRTYPSARAPERPPLSDVLAAWSGLGYNRRAKYLRDAAIEIVEKHRGRVPRDYAVLRALPGVGDYTARAVRVFAFNESDILIETNIRTALIHHFYSSILQNTPIADAELRKLAEGLMKSDGPREWHWALMDYGAHLKASGIRNNDRSAHYAKQSKFEGSARQVRGEILRTFVQGSKGMKGGKRKMFDLVGRTFKGEKGRKWEAALAGLARDGLVVKKGGIWGLPAG